MLMKFDGNMWLLSEYLMEKEQLKMLEYFTAFSLARSKSYRANRNISKSLSRSHLGWDNHGIIVARFAICQTKPTNIQHWWWIQISPLRIRRNNLIQLKFIKIFIAKFAMPNILTLFTWSFLSQIYFYIQWTLSWQKKNWRK